VSYSEHWNENCSPEILYPAKLSFIIDGTIKVFHIKQKLKQYYPPSTSTEDSTRNSAHRR
jgi:hypothetical protein